MPPLSPLLSELAADARLMLLGTLAAATLMLVLWLIHFPMRNASIVDPGWATGLALIALLFAFLAPGYPKRVWLLTSMVVIWGVRLAVYLLFNRVLGHPEEGRYVELRRQWKTNVEFKFLLFFEAQALLCGFLSLPFAIVANDQAPGLGFFEYTGVVVWVIAIVGELAADAQLAAFKRNPANKGKVCAVGLWRYSRHPNYFFEWLIWMAYAIFAFPSPLGLLAMLCPALMLFFLFRITGIPATEAQGLRSRGDAYREYQRTTSVFFPWFPK